MSKKEAPPAPPAEGGEASTSGGGGGSGSGSGSGSGAGPSAALVASVQAKLAALAAGGGAAAAAAGAPVRLGKTKLERKQRYTFWETQPVVQFDADGEPLEDGPIDKPKSVADVKQEPYALPDSFEWCECDIGDAAQCQEVYELLSLNYVEDDDAMFRFNYSPAFLQWALQPPGFRPEWHTGVRVKASRKLVAFISAIPATVVANGQQLPMVEINFLCVHKKLRSKRLAPVMIKEITRRVNLRDIWQAAYTAGVVLPKPVSVCRYWHRSLNPKKLIEAGFSSLAPRMTMARTIKLYKLPPTAATPGLRPMTAADAAGVAELLNSYLARFKLSQHFSTEEVLHWLVPRELVVDTYVISSSGGSGGGGISDVVSFYTLPSSVLGHPEHKEIRAAYMFYTVATSVPLPQLMNDAMALAAAKGYDVFNALNLLENETFLKELKFGIGDGTLQYYLYNWAFRGAPVEAGETGLILL